MESDDLVTEAFLVFFKHVLMFNLNSLEKGKILMFTHIFQMGRNNAN